VRADSREEPELQPARGRIVRTVRTECLDHFVVFGERHPRHLLPEFVAHYHSERYHQGIGGKLIRPQASPSNDNMCRSDPMPLPPRRTAQLLPSERGVTRFDGFWDSTEASEVGKAADRP